MIISDLVACHLFAQKSPRLSEHEARESYVIISSLCPRDVTRVSESYVSVSHPGPFNVVSLVCQDQVQFT